MSWFIYGKHTKKHIGIWLRPSSNPDVIEKIKKSKLKRFGDSISRIVVSEFDKEKNAVWLQIWTKNIFDSIFRKNRYTVFHIKTEINENWVCEGDLGNGFKF